MKDIIKSALSFVGPAFALLLLGFTGYQTFTLIQQVTGSAIIAAIGLILFEGGMMYWWFVFRSEAEGLPQMALSLMVFVTCLVFVVLATALKLGAVTDSVLGASTPAKIITAAAVVQLAAKLVFPLLHPEVSHAIKERSQEGKIIAASDKKFEEKVDSIANTYADARADVQVLRLLTNLNTKYSTSYQLPGGVAPVVIENQPTAQAAPPRQSLKDRLLGRKPEEAAATAPPQPAAEPPTAPQPATDNDALIAALADLIRRGELIVTDTAGSTALSKNTYGIGVPLAQPAAGPGDKPNGPPAASYGPESGNRPM